VLARLRSLARALVGRRQFEDDMSDEMRFHLDAYAADLVRSGIDPQEAHRRARLAFGGVESVKEDARRSRGLRYVDELRQDLRYGLRQMRRAPAFTAAALLSLALGIGANTAIFTLLDFVAISRVPVRDVHQLYFLGHGSDATPGLSSNYPLLERYRRQAQVFTGITGYNHRQLKVQTAGGTEIVDGQYVAGNYHDVLGAPFAVGRGFTSESDQPSERSFIAVISASFWNRRFGRDPNIVGRTMDVDNKTVSIVGVTAPRFHGLRPGTDFEVTLPLALRVIDEPDYLTMRDTWTSLTLVGRVAPGLSESQALAGLDPIFQTFWMEPDNAWVRPKSETRHPARLSPAERGTSGLRTAYSEPLGVLMGMVGLVLLIACVNVANLLIARGVARRRELAIRLSIGAGRLRLVRQLLTESFLLATAGGVLALVLAMWGTTAIVAILKGGNSPIVIDVNPNGRVMAFTFAVSLLTGILFGLAPALQGARLDLTPALRASGHGSARLRRMASGKVLVAGQVALSLLLLVGTGLLVRTLVNLKTLDAGFQKGPLLLFYFDTRGTKSDVMKLYQPLAERLRTLPGVRAASVSTMSPLATTSETRGIRIADDVTPGRVRSAVTNRVIADYFSTFDIPIVRGRGLTPEALATAARVAVVNETMAREYFGGDPLGRVFAFNAFPNVPVTIVGVARDVRQFRLREPVAPMAYVPLDHAEERQSLLTAALRTDAAPRSIEAEVKAAVQATSPDLVVSYMRTMDEQIDSSLQRERLLATLAMAFGALGLVLACVGLYGVMAYGVARRLREFSIRLALGATRAALLRRVLGETLVLIAFGIAAGLAGALAASRFVSAFLYGLTPTDPVTFGAAAVVLLVTSLVAAYLPARRAASADPVRALKME
jgi:predicted permease